MIKLIYKLIQKFLKFLGWDMNVQIDGKIKENSKVNKIVLNKIIRNRDKNKINLNIGSGDYIISNFMNLDFYNEKYYDNKRDFEKTRIHYDMRNDDIPYDNNFVDNIYCSHVIEHVEENYADKFFRECKRVLKKNGVLRIVVPDAKFLYEMATFNNSYFAWHKYYNKKGSMDMLVEKIHTSRHKLENYGLKKKIEEYSYFDLMNELTINSKFDKNNPHNHINYWDFEKIEKYKNKYDFSKIIKSKVNGSASKEMQGDDFDIVHQNMSLYVDLIK